MMKSLLYLTVFLMVAACNMHPKDNRICRYYGNCEAEKTPECSIWGNCGEKKKPDNGCSIWGCKDDKKKTNSLGW